MKVYRDGAHPKYCGSKCGYCHCAKPRMAPHDLGLCIGVVVDMQGKSHRCNSPIAGLKARGRLSGEKRHMKVVPDERRDETSELRRMMEEPGLLRG